MKNIIYFSGTHGVGKTSLISELLKSSKISFLIYDNENPDHHNPYKEDIYKRQYWRLEKYIDDAMKIFEMKNFLKEENKILLVDRCIWDHYCYTLTFKSLQWINSEEYTSILKQYNTHFPDKLLPENIIFIFPEISWTKDRIIERWNKEKVKWNEGDFRYLEKLRENYEKQYQFLEKNGNINLLTLKEVNIKKRVEIIYNHLELI